MNDDIKNGENKNRTNPDRTEGGSTTKGSTNDTVAGRSGERGSSAAVPPNTDTDMAGSKPREDPQDT